MEDALVHVVLTHTIVIGMMGLNPCFNGRCTRTLRKMKVGDIEKWS